MTDLPAWLAASHAAANPRPAYSAFTERRPVPYRNATAPRPLPRTMRPADVRANDPQLAQGERDIARRELQRGDTLGRLADMGAAQSAPDPIHTPLQSNVIAGSRMVLPGAYDAGNAAGRIARGEDAWGDLALNTGMAALPFLGVRGMRGERAPAPESLPRYGANDRGLLERFSAIRAGGDDASLPAPPGFVNTEVYPARLWRRSSNSTFNRTNMGPGPEIGADTYASDNDGILHELIARLEQGMAPEDLAAMRWAENPHAPPPGSTNVGDVPLLGSPDIAADPLANPTRPGLPRTGATPGFMQAPNEDRYLFGRPPAEAPRPNGPPQASDGNAASGGHLATLRAQGFNVDEPLYHGTNRDLSGGFQASDDAELNGVWLAPDPNDASFYATVNGGEGANVTPVFTRGRIVDFNSPEIADWRRRLDDWRFGPRPEGTTWPEPPPGVAGVRGNNLGRAYWEPPIEGGSEEVVVFDPANIRSRFAPPPPDRTPKSLPRRKPPNGGFSMFGAPR